MQIFPNGPSNTENWLYSVLRPYLAVRVRYSYLLLSGNLEQLAAESGRCPSRSTSQAEDRT